MFDQRNQQFSTILLATTIMLSALVCCLAQGVLPHNKNLHPFVYYLYSISTSISVACLFICLVFCVEVMWRASKFMYKRSKYHTGYLAKAIKKTKDMMSAIRGVKSRAAKHSPSNPANRMGRDVVEEIDKRRAWRRNISNMSGHDVEKEFVGHETETSLYHTNREAMIDQSAFMVTADDGSMVESKSFERFWQQSCSFYGNVAVLSFYAGSAALFFANVTFMWAVNLYKYQSLESAQLCAVVILGSLILTMVLLIYIRYIEKISFDNSSAGDEEGDKYSWGSFRNSLAIMSTTGRKSITAGMGRWPTFGGSGPSGHLSDSNDSSDDNDEDEDVRGRAPQHQNSRSRRGRGHTRRGSEGYPLPVAVSLDIPLAVQENYNDYSNLVQVQVPTVGAAFPEVQLPTGTFENNNNNTHTHR